MTFAVESSELSPTSSGAAPRVLERLFPEVTSHATS